MIRIICPCDPTIRCVERQARRLNRRLGEGSRLYVVLPNAQSKSQCHRLISSWDDKDLIVFMGHGRSDALFGSRGRLFDVTGCNDALDKESEEYYNDESFIDNTTYHLLSKKRLVCFSCESNLLAKKLAEAGADAVLGFGKMPTSKYELKYDAHIPTVSDKMVAYINGALNVAFRQSVLMTYKRNGEMTDLQIYFKMELRRQSSLLLHSKAKYRYVMANILYDIAKTVTVIGNKKILINDL